MATAKLNTNSPTGLQIFGGDEATLELQTSGTTRLTLNNAGVVTVSGNLTVTGTITEQSSIAYKENVNPITDALEIISKLTGVTYDKKDKTSLNEPGLIAEEVEKILPNIVSLKDGNPDGIFYSRITAYLIEAIKELKLEIDNLKK